MEIMALKLQEQLNRMRGKRTDLNSIRIRAIDLLRLDERARLYDDNDVDMLLMIVTIFLFLRLRTWYVCIRHFSGSKGRISMPYTYIYR